MNPNQGQLPIKQVPSLEAAKQYSVNRKNQIEGIYQPFYDYQTYPSAGATTLTFFQQPEGSLVNGVNKTRQDTNMKSAGQFPSPTAFLLMGVEIVFFPGTRPVNSGLAEAGAASQSNDQYAFGNSGYLKLEIGSKDYLSDAPLGKFPPRFRLMSEFAIADTTNPDTSRISTADTGAWGGVAYQVTPLLIPQNQNFSVSLNWNQPVGMPSGNDARVGVLLNGFYYRESQ